LEFKLYVSAGELMYAHECTGVLDFTENLITKNIKYVIISGYVTILFGRSRMSEDVDILIEHISFEKFLKFWSKIEKNYECLNTRNSLENRKHVMLVEGSLYISPIELQIPNKLFLGSEKDIEWIKATPNKIWSKQHKEFIDTAFQK